MEASLLTPDFWSDYMTAALNAWAIVIPLLILAFWIGFKFKKINADKQIRGLRAHTEDIELRLQLARDQNIGEAKAIADVRAEVDKLREQIKANAEAPALEPAIKEADETAAALVMANTTTDHILNAKTLAIGGTKRPRSKARSHGVGSGKPPDVGRKNEA
jgi:hypothetical protein